MKILTTSPTILSPFNGQKIFKRSPAFARILLPQDPSDSQVQSVLVSLCGKYKVPNFSSLILVADPTDLRILQIDFKSKISALEPLIASNVLEGNIKDEAQQLYFRIKRSLILLVYCIDPKSPNLQKRVDKSAETINKLAEIKNDFGFYGLYPDCFDGWKEFDKACE